MKLENPRRIIKEEYEEEFIPLIEKLAYVINPFMEQVVNLSNNRVDFDNLFQEIVTLKVIVDANGVPTVDTKFACKKLPNSIGGVVINVQNLTDPSALLTANPFVYFVSVSPNLYKVKQITGLTAGDQFQITLNVIGK